MLKVVCDFVNIASMTLLMKHTDYHEFLRGHFTENAPRGTMARLAKEVRIHTTTLSQILKGDRHLTADQAILVCDFIGFNDLETQYFLTLVEYARAASERLKGFLKKKLRRLRENAENLAYVIPNGNRLPATERAIFYSNWYYAAAAVLCSIPELQTVEAVAQRLRLPKELIARVFEFLVLAGICQQEDGLFVPTLSYTHLEADDPLISRQHGNWRIKAMEIHSVVSGRELCYTTPMSISTVNVQKVRTLLVKAIEEINRLSRDSETCDEAFCLNVDWFKF